MLSRNGYLITYRYPARYNFIDNSDNMMELEFSLIDKIRLVLYYNDIFKRIKFISTFIMCHGLKLQKNTFKIVAMIRRNGMRKHSLSWGPGTSHWYPPLCYFSIPNSKVYQKLMATFSFLRKSDKGFEAMFCFENFT